MKLKHILVGVLLALVFALGLMVWNQAKRAQAAEVRAAALAVERDAAETRAREAEQEALRAAREAERLEAERQVQEAEVRRREARLRRRADSLAAVIPELIPPGQAHDETVAAVNRAVGQLRDTYERRLQDQAVLLRLSDETVAALKAEVAAHERANAGLREALALAQSETDEWRQAAHPGVLSRIRDNAGLLLGAVGLTAVLTAAATGG